MTPDSPLAHDDALSIGREARRKRHAGEIADDLPLAGFDIHQHDARLIAGVGHVGDFLTGRAEPRRQHQFLAGAQEARLAPSWSMIASRLMRFCFGPVSSMNTTRVSK